MLLLMESNRLVQDVMPVFNIDSYETKLNFDFFLMVLLQLLEQFCALVGNRAIQILTIQGNIASN